MKHIVLNRRSFGAAAICTLAGAVASGCSELLRVERSGQAGHGVPDDSVRPLEFSPPDGLAKVNEVRRKFGLRDFVLDPRLQAAAQRHADLMARTGNYGHEFGPDSKFSVRMAAVDFNGSAGENLGVGYGSVEEAIQGWLESPKHRQILLRANFDRAGIAYAFNISGRNSRYTHFWVLDVGKEEPPGGIYIRRV